MYRKAFARLYRKRSLVVATKAEIMQLEPREFFTRGLASVEQGNLSTERFGTLLWEYVAYRKSKKPDTMQSVLDIFEGEIEGEII